uniref:Rhodanese domain-containing protein n=1 Tax=Mucochytrium quahogii TaxID=96639 RepID=A0A7S2RUZ4_9STRA|mmetsp:Transcript_9075/g.17050  ORF Transcript_9075/g.17050 Transcript_9075/m.17050 type:complete len:315 (+) Transcript_9075:2819-3763(+)
MLSILRNVVHCEDIVRHGGLRALKGVQFVDCSWHMDRPARPDYDKERIPGASFMNIDQCADMTSSLPHMMPKKSTIDEYMRGIGLRSADPIVVYETGGIFASPRAWYMLKAAGAEQVAVLNGGLSAWKRNDLDTDTSPPVASCSTGPFSASQDEQAAKYFKNAKDVLGLVKKLSNMEVGGDPAQIGYIIDARNQQRFNGQVDEPRPNTRRGHIPGSLNVPFSSLLDADGGFLPVDVLSNVFTSAGLDVSHAIESKAPLVFSCGSGVTACVPLLALVEYLGVPMEQCAVYDGSWSEWGLDTTNRPLPVEVTANIS